MRLSQALFTGSIDIFSNKSVKAQSLVDEHCADASIDLFQRKVIIEKSNRSTYGLENAMSETLSVFFDGEVFKPETPVKLKANTRYQITLDTQLSSDNFADKFLLIKQNYQLENEKQVQEFLDSNAPLVELLLEAEPAIKEYFPHSELRLKVEPAVDPAPEEEEQLVLTILAQGNIDQVLGWFNKLKSKWWFRAARNLLGQISLALEHPEFSSRMALEELGTLIGSVEAPEDWAAEHDFYLRGSPKRNQSPANG